MKKEILQWCKTIENNHWKVLQILRKSFFAWHPDMDFKALYSFWFAVVLSFIEKAGYTVLS